MALLGNKRRLAAVSIETQEEHPRNSQSRNLSVARINEENITEVSEEIEGRVIKKLSQELSRTESRNLGNLSKLDEFLFKPQVRTLSGTVPGTSRMTYVEDQERTGARSENNAHPEVESSVYQSRSSVDRDPEEASHSAQTCD